MIRFDDILEKVSGYLDAKDIPVLQKAYIFAARAHRGQVRRSGEPYLSHPLEVMGWLANMRLDRTTLVAGLLHDVLEDTASTVAELRDNFGQDVADLVEGVTKIGRVEGVSAETRRAETIRKIILAMTDDLRIIFIKLADRLHNLKTLRYLPEDKQKQVAQETLEIYAPIANRLGMGRVRAELEDLSFRAVAPGEYAEISAIVGPRLKPAEKDLRELQRTLGGLMRANAIPAEIFSRVKRLYSIWSKMKRRKLGFDQVFDFLALRLITDSVQHCYAALGLIHQHWPHLPQRFRDFIAMPKPNLYQALHTTIITAGRKTFEIQIRTREMHALAENGIAAHWKYKEAETPDIQRDDRRLHWLREMASLYEEEKNPREFLKTLRAHLVPEEVYVFTPKGHVVNLPAGASALDFAFKIHSEIGLHASGARVNGSPAPLKTVVKSGDIVEIETSPERWPTRAWLASTVTSGARDQVKRWLNLRSRTTSTALGRRLWERELRRYDIPAALQREEGLVPRLAGALGMKLEGLEDFYRRCGLGQVVVNQKLLEKVFPPGTVVPKKPGFLEKVTARVVGRPGPGIRIRGPEDQAVRLGRCCSPIKGESVVGYLTAGRGVTVHAQRCPLVLKELLDGQRMVDVAWDEAAEGDYRAALLIRAKDSPGVLAQVAAAVADLKGNISKAEVKANADGTASMFLELRIRDIRHLEDIEAKTAALKDVLSVVRG
ncbi:MAG: bifunctional (p)ppGpp synthetase/guanosine-3',5'-bis(diphosphate) 3'-pyrophosphohydrolase [Candidatus Aminicenantes bacterium]|nr:bifunctional (p)ppGpp synthetase/guanosine-3',5'-bis(diphosphate) 3'-pyrophosphohydrolase [Candidatus Aminicenantes bacterium]